jgi:hypothetical protein
VTVTEDNPLEGLVDISGIARSAYVLAHVKKFLEIIDEADSVYAGFPKVLKEQLQCETCGHDDNLNARAKGKLALAFAQLAPSVRDSVRAMLEETKNYIGVWMDEDCPDNSLYGMLDKNDIAVVEEMIGFIQKVGSRSTRHLLTFLQSVNEGEYSYLLIRGKGRDSEVVQRHRLGPAARAEFDID